MSQWPKLGHMKKLFKLATLFAFVAGITWVLRDQLLPGPEAPTSHPPAFRHPPSSPQQSPQAPQAAEPVAADTDDLTKVNGIGPVYAKRLAALGVTSFSELAASDADDLAARSEIARDRIADWINKAADLA